ncbi:uncharacterized protein MYCFIDRAFT_171793 [Pseudocercospora fijiensis CIRAD86]|uniref:F-box domain-containing protein n=1 Tax=Pseudocercospora fijiensis (strain CIRAD86) TaxID=383855 RepID=M3AMY1_PSEFD|nr:uncharacterized protein MYCFIDRAFT_171793 [Pseudocercospora fijiensis CIRAD86]EME85956.1 hypothetical protein MYCFIDRAFT_171793 [Pseudocercospora fijiensis CIRAD86]
MRLHAYQLTGALCAIHFPKSHMLLTLARGSWRSDHAFSLTLDVPKPSPKNRNIIAKMSHLETLSQELFDLVITQLHPSDLPHLRLTSRTCAAKVLDHYAAVHFRDCSVNCDRRKDDIGNSLKIFLKIAQNNTIGSKMQSLILELKADDKNTAAACTDPFDETIQKQLKALFAALSQHQRLKAIRITSEFRLHRNNVEVLSEQTRPLRLVPEGLEGHQFEIDELIIGRDEDDDDLQWSLPYQKLLQVPAQCNAFRSVLQTLTSLRISLWEKEEPADLTSWTMLSKAPRLKFLALHDRHQHEALLCDFNCFK